jgi:peptidyl-prolyl cis-trans isomerase D
MKRRTVLALSAALTLSFGVAACQGLKEALTAHVNVAAKAGSQELTVEQLSKLLAGVQVPVTPDIAKAIANIWVDYQLLGEAAAKNDTLNDPKLVDDALWAFLAQQRVGKYHEQIVKTYNVPSSAGPAAYDKGDFMAAQHILFIVQPTATPAQKDSVRREAQKVHGMLTSANFSAMAQKYSGDPGSASKGGELGVFQKGAMVPQFQAAVLALQPGQISGLVETQFGFHIIRRNTYAEVKDDFERAANGPAIQRADSIYMSGLETAGNVVLKPTAATTVKSIVTDLDAHAKDNTVLATYKGGDFTVARLVRWLSAAPQKEQMADQVRQMPDTAVTGILKQIIRNELVLKAADSAKVVIDSAEMATIHQRYTAAVINSWTQLGITPAILADSGKTPAAREKVAADMANAFMARLMNQQAQFVAIAPPVENVARTKFGYSLSTAGLQRAVEMSTKAKKTADSLKQASRPPSEVPMGAPAPAAPSAPPKPKP